MFALTKNTSVSGLVGLQKTFRTEFNVTLELNVLYGNTNGNNFFPDFVRFQNLFINLNFVRL
jgi:hypothetical protein